ncbi:MAG: hypothetical protein AAF702_27045 [Chloroflexota bacterium]
MPNLIPLNLPTQQHNILQRWLPAIEAFPEVDVVWLEGSLTDSDRANPGADIDLRIAVADDAHDRLWERDRKPLTNGMGEHLILLDWGFIRALTKEEGVIVELAVLKTSELDGKELYDCEFLLNRLPEGQPNFLSLGDKSAAELWPEKEELTTKIVWRETEMTLGNMATCPGPFYLKEWQSIHFIIAETRSSIVRVMYRLIGLGFAKRFKHLSQILPSAYLADLDKTYMQPGADPMDPAAMADTLLRLFAVKGKYIQLLSDKADGGFEPEWYWRLLEQTKEKLDAVMPK